MVALGEQHAAVVVLLADRAEQTVGNGLEGRVGEALVILFVIKEHDH